MLNHQRPSRRATRRRHPAPHRGSRRPPQPPRPTRPNDGVPDGADFPVLAAASRYALDDEAAATAVDWEHPEAPAPPPAETSEEPAPISDANVVGDRHANPDLRPRRTFIPAEGLNPVVGWIAVAVLLAVCVASTLVVLRSNPGSGYVSDPAAETPVPAPAAKTPATVAPRTVGTEPAADSGAIDDSILDGVPTTAP